MTASTALRWLALACFLGALIWETHASRFIAAGLFLWLLSDLIAGGR